MSHGVAGLCGEVEHDRDTEDEDNEVTQGPLPSLLLLEGLLIQEQLDLFSHVLQYTPHLFCPNDQGLHLANGEGHVGVLVLVLRHHGPALVVDDPHG